MINQKITHTTFGAGTVLSVKDNYIKVLFDNSKYGEKIFIYPNAFESFMCFDNSTLQEKTCEELRIMHEKADTEKAAVDAEFKQKQQMEDIRVMLELEKKKKPKAKAETKLKAKAKPKITRIKVKKAEDTTGIQ
jgi:hypothetical protein